MPWTPVDDTQAPNWTQIRPAADGAFQLGAFQPAFQIGAGAAVWTPVNDAQTGAWVPVPP